MGERATMAAVVLVPERPTVPEERVPAAALELPTHPVAVVAGAGDGAPPTDPTLAYLASLSPKGRQTMTERLKAVAALFGRPAAEVAWHRLGFAHVEAIRQRLAEGGAAPATINLTLAALRGIARYAHNLGLMDAEEERRIRAVRPAKGSRLPAGRAATSGELAALVRACLADRPPAGARDAALLAVLYVGGAAQRAGRPRPGRLDR